MKYLKKNILTIRLDDYMNQKVEKFTKETGYPKSEAIRKLINIGLCFLG